MKHVYQLLIINGKQRLTVPLFYDPRACIIFDRLGSITTPAKNYLKCGRYLESQKYQVARNSTHEEAIKITTHIHSSRLEMCRDPTIVPNHFRLLVNKLRITIHGSSRD